MSQQSPLETILENTRLSSFDLIFSKIIIFFFNFHLREAFKPPKNVLDTLASWMETETNIMTFLILNNFMIPPFYLNVGTISKDFNLFFFFIFFQNYPVNQHYRDHQFCHFSTAKIPSWYMAAIRKWLSRERAMLSLSICEIKLWGNWNCEFLQLKTFTTSELAVVLMTTSENWDSTWNSGANSPLFRQFRHQKRVQISQW